ncbi:phosphopantetheine-binding protein [Dyadobacter sp. CY323]|uniref:phosphopantetheine-binding protein n=1 Tax=Dyadobacter sp. CY323 TaxID=2907302 RepID=UPI001F37FAB7|nr:phosphopantetheine-binding protein [Dyadobacter sp. CY323]MCE6992559.1 phosphopantetheine-binding protein [Dyadobacter sp. CY323]
MNIESLKPILKGQIVQYLNLLDINPEDIRDDEPLFGGELGLDSIDSLELVVLLEREYGIKINNPAEGRKILVDVNRMAEYILSNTKPAGA